MSEYDHINHPDASSKFIRRNAAGRLTSKQGRFGFPAIPRVHHLSNMVDIASSPQLLAAVGIDKIGGCLYV
jgi:hypothetical protein